MKHLSRPDIQLYLLAVLTFIAATLVASDLAQVIHMPDIYSTNEGFKAAGALGLFIVLEGAVYSLTWRFRQSRRLQILHVASMPLFPFAFLFSIAPSMPRRYFDYAEPSYYREGNPFDTLTSIVLLLFIIGQILFIVNLIKGFRHGRKAPKDGESNAKYSSTPSIEMRTIALMLLAAGVITQLSFGETLLVEAFMPSVVIAGFFALEALVYELTAHFRQWPLLERFHISSTIAVSVALFVLYYFEFLKNPPPGYHFRIAFDPSMALVWFILIMFFTGLAAFVLNIILGFVRGKKSLTTPSSEATTKKIQK